MKKLLLLNLLILLLISLSACDSLCEKYGAHDLQYVSWNDHHWQECTRDGCNYKTEIVEHCGGKANCKSKAVCKDCGASYGELGDHDMLRKSCTDFAYCQICNFTDGKSNMHGPFAWVADDYLCVRYQKCEDCGFIAQEEPHHTPDEDGILCGKCGMNYLEASLVFHLNGDIQSYTLVDASPV